MISISNLCLLQSLANLGMHASENCKVPFYAGKTLVKRVQTNWARINGCVKEKLAHASHHKVYVQPAYFLIILSMWVRGVEVDFRAEIS